MELPIRGEDDDGDCDDDGNVSEALEAYSLFTIFNELKSESESGNK